MSDRPAPLTREPIEFEPRDRLTADRFNRAFGLLRDLRWLHNREFHDWGIVRGCGVSGDEGATEVRVEDGIAQDIRGRELLVPRPFRVALPETGAGERYYLTLSYDESPHVGEEKATVRWQQVVPTGAADLRQGLDVIAARVEVEGGRVKAVDVKPRRHAVARAVPHMAAGRTPDGRTRWEPWARGGDLAVSAVVCTQEGRFADAPAYQAQVIGERVFCGRAVVGPQFITEAKRDGFRLVVTFPGVTEEALRGLGLGGCARSFCDEVLTRRLGWHVSWFGILN